MAARPTPAFAAATAASEPAKMVAPAMPSESDRRAWLPVELKTVAGVHPCFMRHDSGAQVSFLSVALAAKLQLEVVARPGAIVGGLAGLASVPRVGKLKEALGTELAPAPSASPPSSTATVELSTDAFKGDSSSCA